MMLIILLFLLHFHASYAPVGEASGPLLGSLAGAGAGGPSSHATNTSHSNLVRSHQNNEPTSSNGNAPKLVKLSPHNSSSSANLQNLRHFNYNIQQHFSSGASRQRTSNQSSGAGDSSWSASGSSPGRLHEEPRKQASGKRTANETICIGTSNRMSGQHNKTGHYQTLVERYRNCTHVIGNLEITWLERGPDRRPVDLTFLESIREITGYLLIAYVDVDRIRMPNLQIIRGRDLFKLNNDKEEFAMFLIENELKTLELPNLREIIAGSFGSYNNRNLCVKHIAWEELLNGPNYKTIVTFNGTEPDCPSCDSSCPNGCWGEGPELCQKFSKTVCSPQCSQGRCFGPLPRDCCHLFCAGGCTGPMQTECIACKNFSDDGECILECPSMMRYNPSKFLWEPNPNGKYAFGATCVKECPPHLLRDNGACVRTCPANKRSSDGECVPCVGPCPKNCQGVEVVHSGNIDQLINCTVIEGSITILDSSFTGFAEVYTNNTIGPRYEPMRPERLRVLETVHEITGYLSIQASHPEFRDLAFLKNLEVIGGRQTTDMFYAVQIIKTSLVSLNLRSLKMVRSGRILIEENKDLCFADTIDWSKASITRPHDVTTRNNADSFKCRLQGLHCHGQCSKDGCWGSSSGECLSCRNYKLDDYCIENCTNSLQAVGSLSFDSGMKICKRCHPECKSGCTGSTSKTCLQCKNVQDGPYCVSECPSHKYNNNGTCENCHSSCIGGCTGPSNRLGSGGCNSCSKVVVDFASSTFAGHCIKAEYCPEGYFQEYIDPNADGPLKSASGKTVCRKCHHLCKSCTGMGTHTSVCDCAKYIAGEQCESHCPRDYYADEKLGKCRKCSSECNGCYGPSDSECVTCRVYRLYADSYVPSIATQAAGNEKPAAAAAARQQVKFNCTAQCPPQKPYRISESNMLDPYCSDDPGNDADNPRIIPLGTTLFILVSIISAAIMFCVSVYRCQIEKDKTVKLTMRLSGFDDVEPLNQSNLRPNLAALRSIKETELRQGNILGSGFGGTVYQGLWYPEGREHKGPRPVAIKVLRDTGQSNTHKEFLEEAYIMASVNHPNLVRLLAVCTTSKHFMLVTQLMPLGCLLDYVKKHKNDIGSKNLLEWCKQIARGMSYLEDHRMVHRDLALRNVLLQTSGRALVSDFGLAKFLDVDQSEYYSGGGRLPIKWLAPECIKERSFTHKSDVWAFGVTIWELLTFGMKPFEEYETKDVPNAIEKGARLSQPSYMSAEVYKVMYACWFYNPKDRPNFKTLAENFVNFARDPERFLICRTNGIEYCNRPSDSDENVFDESDMISMEEDDTTRQQQLGGLLQNNLGPPNVIRHHSESDTVSQLLTPTSKKTANIFQGSIESDIDDYLLPSPCSNEDKFKKFLASHEGPSAKLPPIPPSNRDPPHSAGLLGITNDEYFLTRLNYVHSTTNASTSLIPHSLV